MARLNVNPTRMELQKLKTRIKTASRGHKLLKDKSDEMVRQFLIFVKVNKQLREDLENEINNALRSFMLARCRLTNQQIEEMVSVPARLHPFTAGTTSIMGLSVPQISVVAHEANEILPYSLLSGSVGLDKAILTLSGLLDKLIKLAEVEKICDMLAEDIEKNRRRINALEFILIPQINETINYIKMKLDENERNNLIRLMKVKELQDSGS